MAVSNKYLQMTDTGGSEKEKVDKKESVKQDFTKGVGALNSLATGAVAGAMATATNAVLKNG